LAIRRALSVVNIHRVARCALVAPSLRHRSWGQSIALSTFPLSESIFEVFFSALYIFFKKL
jgi:hypothetical protein